MKRMLRTYRSVYPLWYRIGVVWLFPLFVFGFHLWMDDADPDRQLFLLLYIGMLLQIIEIEGDFLSIHCIYKKVEPFGSVVLSSARGRQYLRNFAAADILRHLFTCLFMIGLPAFFSATKNRTESLVVALTAFAVLQFFLWVNRHVAHQLLMVLTMLGAVCTYMFFVAVFLMSESRITRIAIGIMVVLLALTGTILSIASMKKTERECYYDRKTAR